MGQTKRQQRAINELHKLNMKLVREKYILITQPDSEEAKAIIEQAQEAYKGMNTQDVKAKETFEVTIITCMHTRVNVSKIFLESIKRITEYNKDWLKINLFVGASDIEDNKCAMLLDEYGVTYKKYPNEPLSEKWNQTLESALNLFPNTDYICTMGDDDIMNNDYFTTIKPFMVNGDDVFGVKNVYFISPKEENCLMFTYDFEKMMGAGRMFKASVLRDLGSLWNEKENRGLDGLSEKVLKAKGIEPVYIDIPLPMITDIKTGDNIQSYSGYKPHSKVKNINHAFTNMSEEEIKLFKNL